MEKNVIHIRLVLLAILAIFVFPVLACGSTTTPYDYEPSIDDAYDEFQAEQGLRDWEIARQAIQDDGYWDAQYSHEATIDALVEGALDEYGSETGGSSTGCPYGCTTHKTGCDIKGNISFNSGEKIYHVRGQNFYNDTKISPEYGERWFCTEQEAMANGWRKSLN